MPIYCFDTNALIKRYLWDQGSEWVAWALGNRDPAPILIFSELARVELASALYKLERIQNSHPSFTDSLLAQFDRDVRLSGAATQRPQQAIISLTPAVFQRARELLRTYRSGKPNALRSLDAFQLASALLARDDLPPVMQADMTFVSSDKQLLGAAQHEGLVTLRPEYQIIP